MNANFKLIDYYEFTEDYHNADVNTMTLLCKYYCQCF